MEFTQFDLFYKQYKYFHGGTFDDTIFHYGKLSLNFGREVEVVIAVRMGWRMGVIWLISVESFRTETGTATSAGIYSLKALHGFDITTTFFRYRW